MSRTAKKGHRHFRPAIHPADHPAQQGDGKLSSTEFDPVELLPISILMRFAVFCADNRISGDAGAPIPSSETTASIVDSRETDETQDTAQSEDTHHRFRDRRIPLGAVPNDYTAP